MIGNAHPVAGTRYSIIEVGQLDKATFSLKIEYYQLVAPNGEALDSRFESIEMAEQYLHESVLVGE